jgi:hypothetical protein
VPAIGPALFNRTNVSHDKTKQPSGEYMPDDNESLRGIKPDAQVTDKAETADAGGIPPGQVVPPIPPNANGGHGLTSFPVPLVILPHYMTCGLFPLIWLNLMHGKLPRIRPDDPSAGKAVGFCFIPFFNLYWIFFTFRRLCLRI